MPRDHRGGAGGSGTTHTFGYNDHGCSWLSPACKQVASWVMAAAIMMAIRMSRMESDRERMDARKLQVCGACARARVCVCVCVCGCVCGCARAFVRACVCLRRGGGGLERQRLVAS